MDYSLACEILLKTSLLIIIIWYIQFHIKRRNLYKFAEKYKGPPCLPILGNALKFLIPLREITKVILKGAAYYKSPARLWFGPYLSIFIWDPENVKIVLTSQHSLGKHPYIYKLVESITGKGLITLPPDTINNYLWAYVERESPLGFREVKSYLCSTLLRSVITNLCLRFAVKLCVSVNILVLSFLFFTTFQKIGSIAPVLIFEEWQKKSSITGEENNESTYISGLTKPKKFIEHLLSKSDGCGKFTVEELREEVNTFIVAGLESVSGSLGFIMLMLGIHHDIQDKLFQELSQIVDKEKQVHYDDLKRLEYLKELLKNRYEFSPPVSGIARYNEQDIQPKNHTIPAHTTIIIGLISLHRDPNVWPNPNKFDPDRFLPEEENKRHPYSWIPFSAGPRDCVGARFAMMSLKTVVAHIVLKYQIATDYKDVEDVHLTMRLLTEPTNGYRISIIPR